MRHSTIVPQPRRTARPHRQAETTVPGLRTALLLAAMLSACDTSVESHSSPGTRDATGALLPDTATINGVIELRHSATALDEITELVLDSVPLAIYDEPSGKWDMSLISIWHSFSDGRMVGSSIFRNPGLMMFASDGRPERLLAKNGEGPGDIGPQAWNLMFMFRDTLVVFDPTNQRVSRFTSSGFVDDRPWQASYTRDCNQPIGYLTGAGQWLAHCRAPAAALDVESERPMQAIGLGAPGEARVIHSYPGMERRRVLGQTTAGMEMIWARLAFGRTTHVMAWDSIIVVAAQDRGYLLELRDTSGALRREIIVERPLLPLTASIRDTLIALQVVAAGRNDGHGGYREGELERKAREQPFPDSLPPHGVMLLGTDGTLWVFDYLTEADSTWSAMGFRADGAIVGRLSGKGGKYYRPFWFGAGTVLMRQEDDDGLVRFAMYRVVKGEG
jgi:hypothetical protein